MIAQPKYIHFIGICGTAMASVAAALKERGYHISGSDNNVYPPMSTFLADKGITLKSGYAATNLEPGIDVVVVGNAISRGNPELEEVLDRGLYYLALPEVVKEFFLRSRRNLVVTGTHGKTTTTSLLTWILECAGENPSFLIGGIPVNMGQGASFRDSRYVVLEGDEYDTAFFDKRSKFLHYLPEVAIINNIEFDHADIYPNLDAIKLTFQRFVNIVPRKGLIVANGDDSNVREVVAKSIAPILFVGCTKDSQILISDVKFEADASYFQINGGFFKLPLSGMFNVRNAAMAITVARHLKIADAKIQSAVESFKGVKRRQEVRAVVKGVTLIDDFGHHPTAIKETLTALRRKYAGSRVWVFFEPRSNTTRRAVFQNDLPEALSLADGVFVSQVARLDQLPEHDRLDPERVMEDIRKKGKLAFYLPTVEQIVGEAKAQLRKGDIAVIFSNGGFDGIHDKLIAALS